MNSDQISRQAGFVRSGDVDLYYRRFGRAGAVPLAIVHGGNYYDSGDWIEIATALAGDREVLAWDQRGFGASGWSARKDYSLDAQMADLRALLDHFGLRKAVLMGHSMGGSQALVFASRFPEQCAGLILADYRPSAPAQRAIPDRAQFSKVYPTLEAALADTSRDQYAPAGSAQRARLEAILKPVPGGFAFPRDPDFMNRTPLEPAGWTPRIIADDTWLELARVRVPVMAVHGTRSDRYSPEILARMKAEFPAVRCVPVDAGHDLAAGAPGPLIEAVRHFLQHDLGQQG